MKIHLSRMHRERLLWAVALIAPFAAMQSLRLVDLSPTAPAQATSVAASPADAAPAALRLNEAQQAALAWRQSLRLDDLRDPFRSTRHVSAVGLEPDAPVEISVPGVAQEPTPTFVLSGLADGKRGPLAAINGSVFRPGEEVEPGWVLESIDAVKRIVRVRSASGRVLEVAIRSSASAPR